MLLAEITQNGADQRLMYSDKQHLAFRCKREEEREKKSDESTYEDRKEGESAAESRLRKKGESVSCN